MSEFVNCSTCKTDCVRADGNYGYTFCDNHTHPPMTNADRIRSMTDEELKEFLCSLLQCKFCEFEGWGGCELLEWLQPPAEKPEEEGT